MRTNTKLCYLAFTTYTVFFSFVYSAAKYTGCDPNFEKLSQGSNTTEVIKKMYEYLNQGGTNKNNNNINNNSQVPKDSNTLPKYCQKVTTNFSSSSDLSLFNIEYCSQNVKLGKDGLQLDLTSECGTTLVYAQPFIKGKVEVVMKPAPGSGAVTALVLSGPPPSDEIDIEFVGISSDSMQSMFFVKGQRIDPLAKFHSISPIADLTLSFNTYAFEVTDNAVNWFLNGDLVRTLPKNNSLEFPGNTDNFRFGVWDGTNFPNFAGFIDYSSGIKSAFIKSISISPYC
ncbi:hypothetical protein BB561_004896 [Smittium simulii]|uniref:GH16 domain-containing protein n=1 Tax=Smittium simulii TaxID=133385 RepID=A0A2T9YDH5_9FUNG|nr:hypothetical protein BB561_004896 [Smittium simulii]